MIYIKSLNYYLDGGSIEIQIGYINCSDLKDIKILDKNIIINAAFDGDELWYDGWPKEGGTLISNEFKNQIIERLLNWSEHNTEIINTILNKYND